ncbi:MerR family transcriptional regulator [Bacillus sp. T33-2]|uniref:MerR family transcriptional regulator n=1 Tax=Bacillus sp. T33-2 TaxID=2054168 RepID=UPI000C773A7D|nr:MerR family transcriptional regulator [Bacillus sp. T33-2]PLR95138.1 chromosome segregation protein [Bacillus sp. T33-2]
MNTSAVAKLLGVSPSTIQRWVKQAGLQMVRNELGHYMFTEEKIEILRRMQQQINNGALLQDLTVPDKKTRKGSAQITENNLAAEKVLTRMTELEKKLDGKADDIVSYQILQHRREIEELQNQIKKLSERLEMLEEKPVEPIKLPISDKLQAVPDSKPAKNPRKRNFFGISLGF